MSVSPLEGIPDVRPNEIRGAPMPGLFLGESVIGSTKTGRGSLRAPWFCK